jgi:hypothetical protein
LAQGQTNALMEKNWKSRTRSAFLWSLDYDAGGIVDK